LTVFMDKNCNKSSSWKPTIAIATGILGRATETGVRRHINELFGGNTIVLAEKLEPGFTPGRPAFIQFPTTASLAGKAAREFGRGVQSLRYGFSGVPYGSKRRAMEAFLRDNKVSAILAEFGHLGCNLAPVAQEAGIPLFTYFRGFDASKRLQSKRHVEHYRKMVPRMSGLISVSQFLFDNLAKHGISHPNSTVIPTGVDIEVFKPAEKDPGLILAVGRIMDKKAPLVSINAFAASAGDFPDHRLEIIGGGPLREACEARVRELRLTDRITFHGHLPHDEVRRKLARASVFLQHSVTAGDGNTEGLPTSIQEAMASGAVVVSTRHAGIPEAIEDGVNGILVDEHDQQGFTAGLRAVMENESRARQFATAARAAAVEKFDYRKLHARLESLIRTECARQGLPSPATL
jgi:colanic acid/amylovoran biosynthesis glycosyltransferase